MNAPHDMGGRLGDGPVHPEPADAPVFATDWHARAMALTIASSALGQWNIDAMRHARELLPEYNELSYYEKWLAALADMLVERGVVTEAELSGHPGARSPLKALPPEAVAPMLARGAPCNRPGPEPRFAPGDRVRTGPAGNVAHPGGHTRLPAYAANATGVVLALRGAYVFPDSNAHWDGEAPQQLYTVAFNSTDLWPDAAAGDEVTLDLFEPYLAPA